MVVWAVVSGGKFACGFSERLSPGHYRKDEQREEHERHHRGQHEIIVAPGGHEEGHHNGCAQGDGQGEQEGRAQRILLKNTAAITLKRKNARAADLDSARCSSSTATT
jgi:hypothetical protein